VDQFKLEIAEGIAIVKVDIPSATLREAKPMWELFENEMIFDWKKIIIDLTSCTFIDSTFIGMIIKIFRRVNEKESQMKLVFPQITDIESFRVVGITKILECFNSVENAIKSYEPHASVKRIDIDQKSLYHSIMHV
jgi:anti-anti-sigma factor